MDSSRNKERSYAKTLFDYIVIGARPSGCASAALLKKAGYAVTILEKENPGFRKVCGGGIGLEAMSAFRKIGFPVDQIKEVGNRITDYYSIINGSLKRRHLSFDEEAYGLDRKITDRFIREYIETCLGIEIHYGVNVRETYQSNGIINAGGYSARNLILACGATKPPSGLGAPSVMQQEKPVGMSMLVRSERQDAHYFLFDYSEEYHGTYGWIFSLGHGVFNVGLWLKPHDKELLAHEFETFIQKRSRDWIGESYEIIEPRRGFPLGVNTPWSNCPNGLYVVGDAKDGSNPQTGEGLSRAVLSAVNVFGQIPEAKTCSPESIIHIP